MARAITRNREGSTKTKPGANADHPAHMPWSAWKQVLIRVKDSLATDNLSVVCAGIAFLGVLAAFPALAAMVTLYGLIADRTDIEEHLAVVSALMPRDAFEIIRGQLHELVNQGDTKLGLGFVFSVVVALWSASRGAVALMTAMNVAYDEEEKRSFLKKNIVALGFTLGAIVIALAGLVLIGGVPAAVETGAMAPTGSQRVLLWLRWVPMVVLVIAGLAMLYRYGPSRDDARLQWLTPGAILATLLWLIASWAFSFYVSNFGKYNETFGTLAGGVVLLLWFYLSAYVVCVGAELNAELERQTEKDTTVGPPKPKGARGANVADVKDGEG
jgi:membrane protein